MRARWLALALGVLVPPSLAAQQPEGETRLYRMRQGGVEIGRETYRRTPAAVDRSGVIPLINFKLDSRAEYDAAGRLVRFRSQVFNAAGDTLRNNFDVDVLGDSVVVSFGRAERRTRVLHLRADGIVPVQSLSAMVEVAERAGGRDTVFRFLAMGLDTTIPITVRHAGDTALVTAAAVTARISAGGRMLEIREQRIVAQVWNGVDSLPPLAGLRPPVVSYDAPAGASYTAEHVRVVIRPTEGDTFSLAATLSLPRAGRAPFPVVVMMSGSGQQDRDENLWPIAPDYRPFREYAERLAREGIAVLRYDDRTAGESGGSVGGTTADYTDDVRQLVAWLRARSDVDAARVALLGHSEGGVMGPLLASQDQRIRAVVILAGPSKNGRAVVRDQFVWPISTARDLTADERARRLAGVDAAVDEWIGLNPWTRWFATYDPLQAARLLRMPVLIQHGALDRQVTIGQADSLAAAIRAGGNRDVTVKIYPRLNHLFLPTDGDGSPSEYMGLRQQTLPAEVLDDTASWLAIKLRR